MLRIKRMIEDLERKTTLASLPLPPWSARRAVYDGPEQYRYLDEAPSSIAIGDWLADTGTTIFMENEIAIPADWRGDAGTVGLVLRPGAKGVHTMHEGLVTLDGLPYHGIDRNRSFVPLPEDGPATLSVALELFNPAAQVIDGLNRQNEPAEYDPAPLYLLQSELVLLNDEAASLALTMRTYYEAALLLADGDLNKSAIQLALEAVNRKLVLNGEPDWSDRRLMAGAEAELKERLTAVAGYSRGKQHMVGQSHIDLAWLWPAKEAVRKCSRTFSTMSTLLDRHPGFTYAQSQPQAYAYVKQYYPELYGRVKAHIASGRWEIVGGMWVEPDLNIPSGESLVRQLIHGMRFYREEFGVKPRIEWLPDTFGYCASLPQLLRKAGLDYFMTTKMGWNDTNVFPHDLFHWRGIDGSSVLSYVCHGINEYTHPLEVKKHWDSYKQKAAHPEQMLLYGHGDGGGGVTREMIGYVSRSEDLPGLPGCVFSSAHDFFDGIAERKPKLPVWQGDMYLELHRGTYTTHAANKRLNRQAETLYREAEIWDTLAARQGLQASGAGKGGVLEEGWKKLLFNQFHDIIPGTSIPDVYVKSLADYREILALGEKALSSAFSNLERAVDTRGEGVPILLWNSFSWDRSGTVLIGGERDWRGLGVYDEEGRELPSDLVSENGIVKGLALHAENVPQMGYRAVWLRPAARSDAASPELERPFAGEWETAYYRAVWNDKGQIVSLLDKQADREVIAAGEAGNEFQLFHDRPLLWDAWDIDPEFENQPAGEAKLLSGGTVRRGAVRDVITLEWTLSNSVIAQDIIFYHYHGRIDFATRVDWREDHKLLKVSFPVEVLSSSATFEIPFGSIERPTHANTSWESAQFEVCGHRWADLSEGGYGVALLNDCKYGYDVKGNRLRLSLLRAPKWPDPGADRGKHEFTYSLLPHRGGWREAEVVKRGYELNAPIAGTPAGTHGGVLPSVHSFLSAVSSHSIIDSVKPAEDGDGYVLRLYESSGGREKVSLALKEPFQGAYETNLLEEQPSPLPHEGGRLSVPMAPYEVKTIAIRGCPKIPLAIT